ncbi:MAG: hypothetical protein QXF15_00490 [Candidatus Aenigmatarchaeota archaeon]|nr:hypothetical protein [Candidatus Aenigmarchaeota archaeon]
MKILMLCISILIILSFISFTTYALSYIEAKTKFIDAKNTYEQAKNQYILAKQNYTQLRSIERKNIALQKGKQFIINSLERMIAHLELIKSKVESNNALSDSEKQEIISYIEDDLNFFKEKIKEVNSTLTIQELNRYSYEIKNRWTEARRGISRAVGKFELLSIEGIIKKENTISEKIEKIIENLKANGTDTSQIETLFSEFKGNISAVVDYLNLAKEQHNLLINASKEDKEQIINNYLSYLHSAHDALKNANQALKEIFKFLNK